MEPPEEEGDLVQRTAKVEYSFDSETGFGVMDKNINIMVLTGYREQHLECLLSMHPNQLQCRFVDEKARNIIFDKPDGSLDTYVKNIGDLVREVSLPNKLPKKHCEKVIQVEYLNEKFRSVIKQMLEYIVFHHSEGRSLNHNYIGKIYTKGDVVKFGLFEFNNHANPKERSNDMEYVCGMVEGWLGEQVNPNHLIRKLIDKLKQPQTIEMEKLLLTHLAIMPANSLVNFMRNVGDLNDYEKYDTINRICEVLEVDCNNWNTRILDRGHEYLKQIKDGKYLKDGELVNFVDYRYEINTKDNHIEVKKSLLCYCSNCAIHLKDPKVLPLKERYNMYVEILIMNIMSDVLLEFHSRMNAAEIKDFKWFS